MNNIHLSLPFENFYKQRWWKYVDTVAPPIIIFLCLHLACVCVCVCVVHAARIQMKIKHQSNWDPIPISTPWRAIHPLSYDSTRKLSSAQNRPVPGNRRSSLSASAGHYWSRYWEHVDSAWPVAGADRESPHGASTRPWACHRDGPA